MKTISLQYSIIYCVVRMSAEDSELLDHTIRKLCFSC